MNHILEKAFIHFSGDSSVGIAPSYYEMTLYREIDCREELEEIRKLISDLYSVIDDGTPQVLFDFELKAIQEMEEKMEESDRIDFEHDYRESVLGPLPEPEVPYVEDDSEND